MERRKLRELDTGGLPVPRRDRIQAMLDSRREREKGLAGTLIAVVIFGTFILLLVLGYFFGQYIVNWPG